MPRLTLTQAAAALQRGETTATALVEEALQRAEAHRELNAIAWLDPSDALEQAAARDRARQTGQPAGLLHGIPLTVKDLFNVRGTKTQAGSRAPLPPFDDGLPEALAVTRLREAGAVILAKTNLQELALGLTGENPWTGDVKNPRDPARQSGGSSSGAAVAVAVRIGLGALGSDTAGSIRLPASFCGVVGFKPSYGRVPTAGSLPLVPSCDHAGPLAQTVEDVAVLFSVLAGIPPVPLALERSPRLAVPRAYLEGRLTRPVRIAFEALLERLASAGAHVCEVALDIPDPTVVFAPLRAESALIHREALEACPERFSEPVRTALLRGFEFRAVDYLAARKQQLHMREGLHQAMAHAEALLLPAAPCVAPPRGTTCIELESGQADLRQAILWLTLPAALGGLPALALPFDQVEGLPIAVQVIAPFGEDARALQVSYWIERILRS
ncbi:MAG: amidase [Anaerolineae bacterium]|nr:amidase [Anaerolineae bacterium]